MQLWVVCIVSCCVGMAHMRCQVLSFVANNIADISSCLATFRFVTRALRSGMLLRCNRDNISSGKETLRDVEATPHQARPMS